MDPGVGPQQHIEKSMKDTEKCPYFGLNPYISYTENILLLIQAILGVKSAMYLQTTTIHHVDFYIPNTVLQQAGRLFYAGH